MEFCMAILLLERRAGLEQFTDAVVNRADVQDMIRKVHFGVHPEAEAAGFDKMTTIIEIELENGKRIAGRADFGKGSPARPMTDGDLSDKFRDCAAWAGLSCEATDAVLIPRLAHRGPDRRDRAPEAAPQVRRWTRRRRGSAGPHPAALLRRRPVCRPEDLPRCRHDRKQEGARHDGRWVASLVEAGAAGAEHRNWALLLFNA